MEGWFRFTKYRTERNSTGCRFVSEKNKSALSHAKIASGSELPGQKCSYIIEQKEYYNNMVFLM